MSFLARFLLLTIALFAGFSSMAAPVGYVGHVGSLAYKADTRGKIDFTRGVLPRDVTFTRASGRTCINSSGYIYSLGNDQPCFDHDPVTGAPKGLLIEGARTNLLTNSNNFSGNWTPIGSAALSLSQTINGIQYVNLNVAGSLDGFTQTGTASVAVGQFVTYSVVVKFLPINIDQRILFRYGGTGGSDPSVAFRMNNPPTLFGWSNTNTAIWTPIDAFITPVGNDFYRIGITVQNTSAISRNLVNTLQVFGTIAAGDQAIISQPQIEIGSSPSSYIPTTGSAATRVADVATVTMPYTSNDITFKFDNATTQQVNGASSPYEIPTTLNRRWIAKVEVRRPQ